jgi:hypothetical protein
LHDFGLVIAQDQTLSHTFTIRNDTPHGLHIVQAVPDVPCCSAIRPAGNSATPGGVIDVLVEFKVGNPHGRRRIAFHVLTDHPERPTRRFDVYATLVPDIEVIPVAGFDTVLRLNETGTQGFEVVCRRKRGEGRDAPNELVTEPGIAAQFQDKTTIQRLDNGLVESRRNVVVTLPAHSVSGSHRSQVLFKWRDGREVAQPITWTVRPHIIKFPPGITLSARASGARHTIRLSSSERPFRVLSVASSCLAESPLLDQSANRLHEIKLVLNASASAASDTADLRITTDHPDERIVTVAVLVLPTH